MADKRNAPFRLVRAGEAGGSAGRHHARRRGWEGAAADGPAGFARRESRSGHVRHAQRFHAGRISFHSPRLTARLLNLSIGGAAIEAREAPRIGARVMCELETDQTLALIPGQVRWCRLDSTTCDEQGDIIPVYHAGIQFVSGAPVNLLRILRVAGLQRTAGEA